MINFLEKRKCKLCFRIFIARKDRNTLFCSRICYEKNRQQNKILYFCKKCNKQISYRQNYCRSCSFKEKYKNPKNHPMYGKHHSIQSKKSIGVANSLKIGIKASNYKHGRYSKIYKFYCLLCSKVLSHKTNSKYCHICSSLLRKGIKRPNHSLFMKGKNNPNYKHGKSKFRNRFQVTRKYKDWRQFIFQRDNYTCQKCNQKGGNLEAHHIKPFNLFPKLRLQKDNGITLCLICHKNLHRKEKLHEHESRLQD